MSLSQTECRGVVVTYAGAEGCVSMWPYIGENPVPPLADTALQAEGEVMAADLWRGEGRKKWKGVERREESEEDVEGKEEREVRKKD